MWGRKFKACCVGHHTVCANVYVCVFMFVLSCHICVQGSAELGRAVPIDTKKIPGVRRALGWWPLWRKQREGEGPPGSQTNGSRQAWG